MASVGQRKRNKMQRKQWAEANGMGLPPVCKKSQHRQAGKFARPAEDASLGPLRTRCHHAGLTITEANMRAVRAQSYEGQAGLAINAAAVDRADADRLWTVFTGLDGAEARYYRLVIGLSRHAKTAKIEMEPEPIQTRPDDVPDLRDDDQRIRDAVNGWMRWQGYLGHLASHEQTAIHDALKQRCDMATEGRLTTAGQAFIASLRTLAAVVERG